MIAGLEQAGPSFDGHVFLNNPSAARGTERTSGAGYAGAFHVFGQGAAEADPGGGAIAPITKRLRATDAVRAALRDGDRLTVTIVPVPRSAGPLAPLRPTSRLSFSSGRRAGPRAGARRRPRWAGRYCPRSS